MGVSTIFDQIIVVSPGSDYGCILFNDIKELPNATVLEGPLKKCSKIVKLLHHIHFSFFLNRTFSLPFQSAWKHMYSTSNFTFDSNKNYCVIFSDVSACRTDKSYLKKLGNMSNITLCLYNVNLISKKERLLKERFGVFDYIFSFDEGDSRKYGFLYYPLTYSSHHTIIPNTRDKKYHSDAFFIGNNSGRIEKIKKVYKSITSKGAKAIFYVCGVRKKDQNVKGIHYNKRLPYSEVLKYIANTNCIVELVIDGEVGGTMRYQEALTFKKKLLTDNEAASSLSTFDSRYMKIIDNYDCIEASFIKTNEMVEYFYDNEYSPIYLVDFISKLVNKG